MVKLQKLYFQILILLGLGAGFSTPVIAANPCIQGELFDILIYRKSNAVVYWCETVDPSGNTALSIYGRRYAGEAPELTQKPPVRRKARKVRRAVRKAAKKKGLVQQDRIKLFREIVAMIDPSVDFRIWIMDHIKEFPSDISIEELEEDGGFTGYDDESVTASWTPDGNAEHDTLFSIKLEFLEHFAEDIYYSIIEHDYWEIHSHNANFINCNEALAECDFSYEF